MRTKSTMILAALLLASLAAAAPAGAAEPVAAPAVPAVDLGAQAPPATPALGEGQQGALAPAEAEAVWMSDCPGGNQQVCACMTPCEYDYLTCLDNCPPLFSPGRFECLADCHGAYYGCVPC